MPASQLATQLTVPRELWHQGRVAEAEKVLRDLVRQDPHREDTSTLLAELLRSQGRLGAACQVMRDLCRIRDCETALSLRAAHFMQQCDRHAMAREICESALAKSTEPHPELLLLAGHVARESGDFVAARAHYLAALDANIDLDRYHVLSALTNTRRYTDTSDPDITRCAEHFRNTAYSPRSRASAGFALAKIRDDLGDYQAAAQILRESNALTQRAAWKSAAWKQFVDDRTRERTMRIPKSEVADFIPIFVVGIPRSGTTLAASLLARATEARDRGESRVLRFIADTLTSGSHLKNPSAMAEAAALYRKLTVQDDARSTHYIDQDPLNFRYLHIAEAMFPHVRVIHLRRDPRDTALSLWSQDFAHPDMAFAYDFADMSAFMEGHDALMQHWHASLHVPIYELDYERLVTETESTLAELRAFIGAPARHSELPEDSAPVQSASVWQARQPIYQTSVGRWRRYAPYVPELAQFGEPR